MSFFGFDSSGNNQAAPGFFQANDPFAGLSGQQAPSSRAIDFEDTYDGLGDQLQEAGDELNDDTFGGDAGPAGGAVGKDFDFFGRTAQVANVIDEEQMLYSRNNPSTRSAHAAPVQQYIPVQNQPYYGYGQPAQAAHRPARTGYEKYQTQQLQTQQPGDLQVDQALWNTAPQNHLTHTPAQQPAAPPVARKAVFLDEIETEIFGTKARNQAEAASAAQAHPQQPAPQHQFQSHHVQGHQLAQGGFESNDFYSRPNRIEQQPHTADQQHVGQAPQYPGPGQPIQILQRPQSKGQQPHQNIPHAPSPMAQPRQPVQQQIQPTQILQNPNRISGDAARVGLQHNIPTRPAHLAHLSVDQNPAANHPVQIADLSENDRVVNQEREALRAKRNHKIYQLSRDNGIMTPHDKNFITRIQLQQLVQATGNPADHGTHNAYVEDFYYKVHNDIRGGQRQNPSQPLNNFAQTYLHQTGNRPGGNRGRNRAGPENHMQRMAQQVERAVEAAKNKPKNSQLVIEGSLGKISFSNAKTPKPLLNIKRTDSNGDVNRQGTPQKSQGSTSSGYNRKTTLQDAEKVYDTLMKLEDHNRAIPGPVSDEGNTDLIQAHAAWLEESQKLNEKLWRELKIHEPAPAGAAIHPFVAMLETAKGKKMVPRVFRHTNLEQRTTILTMIIVNLDKLDVVRRGSVTDGFVDLDAKLREAIELFSIAVVNTLFVFLGELGLNIITGILGLFVSNVNVDLVARTRVGVNILTMVLSRAEILLQSAGVRDGIRNQDGGTW